MHPIEHARASAAKWGGKPEDYVHIHHWFDESKAFIADFRHRALRHHTQGIFEAEQVFGMTTRNSDGKEIPTRYIGEQHVKDDLGGKIPTVSDWFENIKPQPWMMKSSVRPEITISTQPQQCPVCNTLDCKEPIEHDENGAYHTLFPALWGKEKRMEWQRMEGLK